MLAKIAVGLSILGLMACTVPDVPSDLACEGSCDEELEAMINGMPAEEYFELLTYQVDQERSVTPFRRVSDWVNFTLDNGNKASADLYLLDSGSYVVEYEEWKRTSSSTSEKVGESEIVEGTWRVEGVTLVLSDLATAQGVDFVTDDGPVPGLAMTFDRDIRSAGLAGSPMTMAQVFSSAGLFHTLDAFDDGICQPELGEYCAYGSDCGECECGDGLCQAAFDSETVDSCPSDCVR